MFLKLKDKNPFELRISCCNKQKNIIISEWEYFL